MKRRAFLRGAAAMGAACALWPRSALAADAQNVKKVYVALKTHLDVGYTDLVANVLDRYFNHFIPSAIDLARRLREESPGTRMVWTTGAWLIDQYLERSTGEARRAMEKAIAEGDVAWHAIPLTFHSELVEADHFRHGLGIAKRLDERFGVTTVAAKMTDVPGHTRAIVPLLAEAGIKFLHIGVNPASTAPKVPDLFRWKDENTNSDLIVAYTKDGYGNIVLRPGDASALFISMTGDNHGPQSVQAVEDLYRKLQQEYPNAEIRAGRMDDYVRDILPERDALPVVTQELGDTWIHGVGCDPRTTIPYRELCRLRKQWIAEGLDPAHAEAMDAFSNRLLLVPEHTWGLSEMYSLDDFEHYTKEEFAPLRTQPNYQRLEQAWADKRNHNAAAVAHLDGTPYAPAAKKALDRATPARPELSDYSRVTAPHEVQDAGCFQVRFSENGAIDHLVAEPGSRQWCDAAHPLALFGYQVFALDAFERFYDAYTTYDVDWGRGDLGKVCLDRAKPNYAKAVSHDQAWRPRLTALYRRDTEMRTIFLAELAGPDEACERFGCPRRLFTEYAFAKEKPEIAVDFQFFDKDASRIGESLWLSFTPRIADPSGWTLFKMGQPVNPGGVIPCGNQYLHAVDPGVTYRDAEGALRIDSPDAALCAPGEPSLLRFDDEPADLAKGVHFNLYNNVWGTNFRSWYEEDTRFRFALHLA